MSEDLLFTLDEGVATLTLNRPEAGNAVSHDMLVGLCDAYRRVDEDDDIRVAVVTGAGGAFCTGADMSGGASTFEAQEDAEFSAAAIDPPAFALRKLVIAAVNGHAVGLGFTLALQCDFRIFARDAKYGALQVRRGVMPDAYAHFTLPRIVGFGRAADLLLSGRKIDGAEAYELGIATRLEANDAVLETALELARDLATNTAPLSVAVTKRLLWESGTLSPREIERKETALHHHLMGKPDAVEGVVAFLERRPPKWSLRVSRDWPEWPE